MGDDLGGQALLVEHCIVEFAFSEEGPVQSAAKQVGTWHWAIVEYGGAEVRRLKVHTGMKASMLERGAEQGGMSEGAFSKDQRTGGGSVEFPCGEIQSAGIECGGLGNGQGFGMGMQVVAQRIQAGLWRVYRPPPADWRQASRSRHGHCRQVGRRGLRVLCCVGRW